MRVSKWFGIFVVAVFAIASCKEGSEMKESTDTPGGTTMEAPATAAAPPPAATPTGGSTALDGKTFAIQMTNLSDPAAAKMADQLVFTGGTFESAACRPFGFTVSGYMAEEAAGVMTFKATSMSPTSGTMEWTGTIRGSEVDGTAKQTDQAGKVIMYTFMGSLASGATG